MLAAGASGYGSSANGKENRGTTAAQRQACMALRNIAVRCVPHNAHLCRETSQPVTFESLRGCHQGLACAVARQPSWHGEVVMPKVCY